MFSSPKSVKMMSSVSQNQMTSSFPSYAIWRRWTSGGHHQKFIWIPKETGDWGRLNFLVPSLPSPYKIQNGGREVVVVREKGFTSGPLSIMAFQLRNARVFICLLRQYSVNHFSFQVCCKSRRQVSRPPGRYSWEFLVGVCRPVLQILTRFQTKKCHFPHRFQTSPLKSIPVCKPSLKAEIMSLLLRLERNQKKFFQLNLEFAYFSFFPFHLELKR